MCASSELARLPAEIGGSRVAGVTTFDVRFEGQLCCTVAFFVLNFNKVNLFTLSSQVIRSTVVLVAVVVETGFVTRMVQLMLMAMMVTYRKC